MSSTLWNSKRNGRYQPTRGPLTDHERPRDPNAPWRSPRSSGTFQTFGELEKNTSRSNNRPLTHTITNASAAPTTPSRAPLLPIHNLSLSLSGTGQQQRNQSRFRALNNRLTVDWAVKATVTSQHPETSAADGCLGPVSPSLWVDGPIHEVKKQYEPGMLIRMVLHESHRIDTRNTSTWNSNSNVIADPIDKHTTATLYGNVHSKVRMMLVVALYENHYIAIPMYTHKYNGLEGIRQKDEHVSVKDHRSPESCTKQSKHRLLVTSRLYADARILDPKTTAQLTYPISRSYNTPAIHMAYLDAYSTAYLRQLYSEQLPKGNKVLDFGSVALARAKADN